MPKKIISAFIFLMVIAGCISCQTKNTSTSTSDVDSNNPQSLQILKADTTLTQEQVMSQIKASNLKTNNGYKDSDEVIVIVSLPGDALIDTFLAKYTNSLDSVSTYALSVKGTEQRNRLIEQQETLIKELQDKGLIISVEDSYTTVMNAVSVKTTYANFLKISELASVSMATLSDTYNLPQSTSSSDASAIINQVEVYPTGIFDSSSVTYTGEGTAVAILDSGFDCSHSVFSTLPENPKYTMKSIDAKFAQLNAKAFTKGLKLTDVYYNSKIPFVYDYADKDSDVFPYDSEHGTHVAGIIGGEDETITGVAVNTQLVLLKVFPDLDSGANTADIISALEDATTLGVDAINMSLGSSCGFTRDEDDAHINEVYDKIGESGISLITAASNSYSSSFGGAQGDTNFVTNPDSGTVGSPSTYSSALSVASISGVKSKYLYANDSQVIFFKESNNMSGKENNFFKELGITDGAKKTVEYVTIPGVGLKVNFIGVDVKGKIALIKRGDNTFEEKAANAKNAGAIGCIIYNNIDGDILMSMGKSDHIPTMSISKSDGTKLAERASGTLEINDKNQAGPFMSDFSSWGPTASLDLKPEITAHGGTIKSSIPGGGYDELSGTSMASPNLCGIVVLIRQYIHENFPDLKSSAEITALCNQLMMSTAGIVLNEEGNPYSPRKQGAGLASLKNAVTTKAYLTVDGCNRTKLELRDDPDKTGVYVMNFNVVNFSNESLAYKLNVIGMTESVSTSDNKHVAESDQILNGNKKYEVVEGGTLTGDEVVVNANTTAKIRVTFTLTQEEKDLIDSLFPNGMYVEGFVTLEAVDENEVDLNIPFLAFYGDWLKAPLFDTDYYEVESEAHNLAIDDEDKIKADYYATTPYGSYMYNYIIPLGTYLYDLDTTKYDAIPASRDHIAISNQLATIDGISVVYAGLLRNAKKMTYTITDKVTGKVVYTHIDNNATKSYYNGTAMPSFDFLKTKSTELGLVNNRQYEFKMVGLLDYGDGGLTTNLKNTFSFDFTLDSEAPVIKEAVYEKVYDKTLKKDRYYVTLTIYDNQYVQSVTPIMFTSNSTYTFLTDNPIPVYSTKGANNKVRFEVTDYMKDLGSDYMITSSLAFSVDDYALNSNIFLCQLPGTNGDFKFTKNGETSGGDLNVLSLYEGDICDLTQYLTTGDVRDDNDKSYLNYLKWSSSNAVIANIQDGVIHCYRAGKTTITVEENLYGKKAVLIINVKEKPKSRKIGETTTETRKVATSFDDTKLESIRFDYFKTLFAYARSAQTSEIGETGSRSYISSLPNGINFYPGEKIQLHYDLEPWYVKDVTDKYQLTYSSTNPSVATVDQDGVVTGLKKGSTIIMLSVEGSNQVARVRITIKSEFIIENRMLVAYKGLGGDVVIPDDEGILYIGSYAFCLYDTDRTVELTDDDYDANKIPNANTTVKSVTIPEGVEEIQKFAFYNCSGLESIKLPSTLKTIREYAFTNDKSLKTIDLSTVTVIGGSCFRNCTSLNNLNFSKIYAIGAYAFDGCSSLESADLSTLRNTGTTAFRNCTSLKNVTLSENTKLSTAMFVNTAIEKIDIYEKIAVPEFCFAQCKNLKEVILHNDLVSVNKGAFSECNQLDSVLFEGSVGELGEQAFYADVALEKISLPDSEVSLGSYCFYKCFNLTTLVLQNNTIINNLNGAIFEETRLSQILVSSANENYVSNNGLLFNKEGNKIIFACVGKGFGDLVLDDSITEIGSSSFGGVTISSLTITNKNTIIGDYAFANCDSLTTVNLPSEKGVIICRHAFNDASSLTTVTNLEYVTSIGEYAFNNSNLTTVSFGDDVQIGKGAFLGSRVTTVTFGANDQVGEGAFQNCSYLTTVKMPENGGVHFGAACFSKDVQLNDIDLSKTDDSIERETFYGCTNLRSATLTNVKTIDKFAFADCSSLNYISMPIVESIGEGAFAKYSDNGTAPSFSELILPNTLTSVGDGVFLGCCGIVEITLPTSLTKVGDLMFSLCTNLQKVVLPKNITSIGKRGFQGCESLTDINLENITSIGEYAFYQAKSLTTVDLKGAKNIGFGAFSTTILNCDIVANNLVSIGDYAFQKTYLKSFVAPNVETIGEGAFDTSSFIKEFTFSSSLKEIKPFAFNGCSKLAEFNFIENGEKKTTGTINDYAFLVDGVLYTVMESGHYQLTSVPCAKENETLTVVDGTTRVDDFAGNANEHVTKIVLPDSMKLIGQHAFEGYKALATVEFKSQTAPSLEDSFSEDIHLSEKDPAYALIHKVFDLFNLDLTYYNFVALVGTFAPIKMILPANDVITGYDSLVYQAYFGKVEDSERSSYVAREENLVKFENYYEQLSKIDTITLSNEDLVSKAIIAFNGIKQDPTQYGYTAEEWASRKEIVYAAKKTIFNLKLSNASKAVQNLQKQLDGLSTSFDISKLGILKDTSAKYNDLTKDERKLLDLSNYNALVSSYNTYVSNVNSEAEQIAKIADSTFIRYAISATALLAFAFVVLKKRMVK